MPTLRLTQHADTQPDRYRIASSRVWATRRARHFNCTWSLGSPNS